MNRVLIIEDEPMLRETLVRGLGKLPGVETVGAASLESALMLVDEQTPDLVISDLDLPGRPGVEIIGELGRRGAQVPILFVSAYVRAFAAQIPRNLGVEVLEKPVPLETLREKIRSRLSKGETKTSGAPFGVAEYLQIACLGRHSVRIEAEDDPDNSYGSLIVHHGELWSAIDAGGAGEDAFRRIVARAPRLLRVTGLDGAPGERDVEAPWEPLLLDAFREMDEQNRHGGSSSPSDGPVGDAASTEAQREAPNEAQSAEGAGTTLEGQLEPEEAPVATSGENELAKLLDEGLDALLSRHYPAALIAFQRARELAPDDRRVEANLARLKELGYGAEES